ncbi:hypothetical protein [uncultured Olleya sp.]|uniref:hypothetical protein n=1 Tax=uncultured Olleya sp. TaxID=757243 RepID=UPI0025944EE6|nr:hypothetical protein [uncultured Olleya sp.]
MRKILDYTSSSEQFPAYFNSFLNTYKNQITCPPFNVGTTGYPQQHLFKRIIAVGMDETFEEYFFDFDEGDIDFNAYDIVNGEKETVLDWIEKWLKTGRGNNEMITEIATVLKEDYGAKKGKELPDK